MSKSLKKYRLTAAGQAKITQMDRNKVAFPARAAAGHFRAFVQARNGYRVDLYTVTDRQAESAIKAGLTTYFELNPESAEGKKAIKAIADAEAKALAEKAAQAAALKAADEAAAKAAAAAKAEEERLAKEAKAAADEAAAKAAKATNTAKK